VPVDSTESLAWFHRLSHSAAGRMGVRAAGTNSACKRKRKRPKSTQPRLTHLMT